MTTNDRKETLLKLLLAVATRMAELKKGIMDSTECDNLSVAGLQYVEVIADRQSMTMAELSQHMGVSKPSITSMVAKLVDAGLVQKEQSWDDRRVYNVCLTDKGERIIAQHRATFEAFAEHAAEKLSADELDALLLLLAKIT